MEIKIKACYGESCENDKGDCPFAGEDYCKLLDHTFTERKGVIENCPLKKEDIVILYDQRTQTT